MNTAHAMARRETTLWHTACSTAATVPLAQVHLFEGAIIIIIIIIIIMSDAPGLPIRRLWG